MGDRSLVVTIDTYVVSVGIAGCIKGCRRITVLPRGNVGRIANPDARMYFTCSGKFLHLLHLAVREGNMVDEGALGGDGDEVWQLTLEC